MAKKVLMWVGLVVLIVGAFFGGYEVNKREVSSKEPNVGSVARANEYHSTTTISSNVAGDYIVTSGSSVLGSIIIVSSSATSFSILDNDSVTSTPTTTVATFKAGLAEGTYTFDVALYGGLTISLPSGFSGQFITTYR